jgi:hypothetical protein
MTQIEKNCAIDWWDVKLDQTARESLASSHYPNEPFGVVDCDIKLIRDMYEKETKAKCE